jgi:hypothetical protein
MEIPIKRESKPTEPEKKPFSSAKPFRRAGMKMQDARIAKFSNRAALNLKQGRGGVLKKPKRQKEKIVLKTR